MLGRAGFCTFVIYLYSEQLVHLKQMGMGDRQRNGISGICRHISSLAPYAATVHLSPIFNLLLLFHLYVQCFFMSQILYRKHANEKRNVMWICSGAEKLNTKNTELAAILFVTHWFLAMTQICLLIFFFVFYSDFNFLVCIRSKTLEVEYLAFICYVIFTSFSPLVLCNRGKAAKGHRTS